MRVVENCIATTLDHQEPIHFHELKIPQIEIKGNHEQDQDARCK
jgi:hypothetical protein